MKKLPIVAIALFVLSLLITVDLWNNYSHNLVPQDGSISAMYSVMHRLFGVFGDSGWSTERFRSAFALSAFISFGLGVISLQLLYLKSRTRKS